jgi:hypothetical protein
MGFACSAVVILALCIFWVYQFVQLMLLSEADFPGKYDKCLWAAAFILVFWLAPFAFLAWQSAYAARSSEKDMLASPSGPRGEA